MLKLPDTIKKKNIVKEKTIDDCALNNKIIVIVGVFLYNQTIVLFTFAVYETSILLNKKHEKCN